MYDANTLMTLAEARQAVLRGETLTKEQMKHALDQLREAREMTKQSTSGSRAKKAAAPTKSASDMLDELENL